MSIEAMKLALEALNEAVAFQEGGRQKAICAVKALRAAIQQAETQQPATGEQDADGLPPIVAGAVFDFAGFMTTRSEVIEVGSVAAAGPVAELVKEWAELRGLDLANADVLSWQLHITRASLPATPEPVLDVRCEGCGYMTHHREHMGCVRSAKQHTHPAPSVPDGLQWFTVAEHGLPEVGEVVVGGLWYTDPWLKPECATSFMWGQCRVVDTKHRDFKDGKQWLTFGPSHNQITHWARLNPPAMLAAKDTK